MKRNLTVLLFFLPIFFFSQSISEKSALDMNYPRISNPDFSIRENTVRFSFDYSDVAGSIQDARITLVVSVPINRRMDRFLEYHYVLGGWKGFFWSASDNLKLTRGRITTRVELPWYTGINQDTNINGFGLAVADSRKFISNPLFVEGEIIRETFFNRIMKLVKEVLA